MITYLQAVNRVLQKLRQNQVTSLSGADSYTSLIAALVNEAKEEVEQAWDWNCLNTTITISTIAGTSDYSLTGSGDNFELYDAWDISHGWRLQGPYTGYRANSNTILAGTANLPIEFSFSGQDVNGDATITLNPVPSTSGIQFKFWLYVRQTYLNINTDSSTNILVPWKPVVYGAYAKAIAERGEDGGVLAGKADAEYSKALSDAIAIDASRGHQETDWIAH